jgi:hypothetical protein
MVVRRGVLSVALSALAMVGVGCTAAGSAGTTSTMNPPTTGKVVGLTENRYCGGPVSPSGCQAPYSPVSDRVTLVPHIAAVDPLILQSGSDGTFSAELLPGEWVLTAAVISPGGSTDCPSVVVDVMAGATTPVTLKCTVELP